MITSLEYSYTHIVRWDLISRFFIKNSYKIAGIYKINLRMHEQSPKNYKDRYILALILETLGTQRVANRLIIKNRYKKSLTVKQTSNAIHLQLTLRKMNMFMFLDKFFLYIMPQSSNLSNYKDIQIGKAGEISFYSKELIFSPDLYKITPMLYKTGSIQLHFVGKNTLPKLTDYILTSFRFPSGIEGEVLLQALPSYNFFNRVS